MNVNDQKELVLCPGDRIWCKSAIHGDRYHHAVIKEIYHGPRRRIRQDIFETPTKLSLIQRYVLKDGEKVNRMPPEGRIMMGYQSLVPGKFQPATCPFNEMASTFVAAAEEGAKAVGVQEKLLLHKLKNPKANYMDFK